jgi:hypothetical protein
MKTAGKLDYNDGANSSFKGIKSSENKSELSRSAGQEQLPDIGEEDYVLSEDQQTVNFNLTSTNAGKAPKNTEMLNSSAISRGSGMSSGNFCLAAENIFSMNEKVSVFQKLNKKLECDKERLSV